MGATVKEAALATGMSESLVHKMLTQPEWRAIADGTKAKSADLLKAALDVLEDAVAATLDGDADKPNYLVRTKASEAIMKNAEMIEKIQGGKIEHDELEGIISVFPVPDDALGE